MSVVDTFKVYRLSESKPLESVTHNRYELKRLEMADNAEKVLWTILTFKIPPEGQTNKLQFPQTHVLYTVSSYSDKSVGTFVSFVVEDELRKINIGDLVLVEKDKKHIISNPDSEKSAIITMHHPGKLVLRDKSGRNIEDEGISLDSGVVEVEHKKSEQIRVPEI